MRGGPLSTTNEALILALNKELYAPTKSEKSSPSVFQ